MPEIVFKGKEYVYNHHLTVPYRPLVAHADKGVGEPDLAGNLIVHGDNLHALKSLLPRCAGAVDLVFIDPPYNTGNEGWCYSDGVNSPIMKEWLSTNPVDGEDLLRHDKWLCMMWPRLVLLRELLSERGSIWITLDDNEVHRARCLLDELFGEDGFVAAVVWQARYSVSSDAAVSNSHNHILVYSKAPETWKALRNRVERDEKQSRQYTNPDNDPNGPWRAIPWDAPNVRENLSYPILTPQGSVRFPPKGRCWSREENQWLALVEQGLAYFGRDGNGVPSFKRYLKDADTVVPTTWWPHDTSGHTDEASKELSNFGLDISFATPKPVRLIEKIIGIATQADALILDSFAGSGTTAHAVLKANAKDGGSRRFILIEGEDYANTLTAERVRRAINGYAWSGTQRETLLEEKITLTQFKKAEQWLAKVDAIKRAEGLADDAGGAQAPLMAEGVVATPPKRKRFDKIDVKIDDGVLRVEGVRRVSQMAPGLGGRFTYCTLGEAVELDKLLSGEQLPGFEALGAWLFYTATGGTLAPTPAGAPTHYLGEALDKHVWLIYRPDLNWLKSPEAALTLSLAESLRGWGLAHDAERGRAPKGHLVFAPAKYLSNRQLKDCGVEFSPLPFALYRAG
jgi:adenine-specific DNA-methyltransferase